MSTYTEKIADKLNDLIRKNIDAQEGFEKAADNAESDGLARYFKRKAAERATFASELKKEVNFTGEEAEDDGSISGTAHRAWMDIKALFSSEDDEAMLEEAIRGDKTAVKEYRETLEHEIPQNIASMLSDQMHTIEADLQKIRKLEDIQD